MTTRKEGQNYQLISVCDRDIMTSYYNTLEEAQNAMCNILRQIYYVEKAIEENPDYLDKDGKLKLDIEENDFEVREWYAWANDESDYDFVIEEL